METHPTLITCKVPEGYTGCAEELPGANTQGVTLDEVHDNLCEAVALVIEANQSLTERGQEGPGHAREDLYAPY